MTALWVAGSLVMAAAVLGWPALAAAAQWPIDGSGWRTDWLRRWRGPDALCSGWRSAGAVAAVGGLLGGVLAGPVAAGLLAIYAACAARVVARAQQVRRRAAARSEALDKLCAVAADLRAGRPPGRPDIADARLAALATSVWLLAERTGAPAAELVERIEADARATDRARAVAAAQAAGARATAWLLAALPLGGVGLGYGIGADPLAVLLHTPVGAACGFGAVALQIAGLAWTDRLARVRP